MARGIAVPDDSSDPYEGLDADERAEAHAAEARLAQATESDDAWGPPPREAGTVLRFRSMWTVVGALVIAGSVVGAVTSQQVLVCGVVAAVGLVLTARGLGSVRRIEVTRSGGAPHRDYFQLLVALGGQAPSHPRPRDERPVALRLSR
jgi:hypothetical protein